ncbi:MAG: sigma-70 family RNA polymerase sigma factor [Ktedonobacteraceae bacterium]
MNHRFHFMPNVHASLISPDTLEEPEKLEEDATHQYLDEIGRFPLLSRAEEQELFSQLARGRAESHDAEKHAQGQAAQQRLVACNLRLVVSLAKRYSTHSMPLLDLIQEGNLGLLHAIEVFDASRGYRLSTVATSWIRQAITRVIANQARLIRLPVHIQEQLAHLRRAEAQWIERMGRKPTAEELAAHLSLSVTTLQELLLISSETLRLDFPLDLTTSTHTLGDVLPDEPQEDPFEIVSRKMFQEHLQERMRTAFLQLTPREQRILTLRYGLEDGQERTLATVGRMFGLTRERIRQLEQKALRVLRALLDEPPGVASDVTSSDEDR